MSEELNDRDQVKIKQLWADLKTGVHGAESCLELHLERGSWATKSEEGEMRNADMEN